MVLKPTAISYVSPQFRNCLNFLKWRTSSLSVRIGHRRLRQTWEKPPRLRSSMFLFLFFNKCIHFSIFSRWFLDMSWLFLSATNGGLRLCNFYFHVFLNDLSITTISHSVSLSDATRPSVKYIFKFVSPGPNLKSAQFETTLEICNCREMEN